MRRVCLVGGGHTHALALGPMAAALRGRAEITLVSPSRHTPYSGMVPGTIERVYGDREFLIDLESLARRHSVRWVPDEAVSLDTRRNVVGTRGGALLRFDVASLNLGGVTRPVGRLGADAVHVRPVGRFLDWLGWIDEYAGGEHSLCVVGGGAAGVEVACALQQRVRRRLGTLPPGFRIAILEAGERILPGYSAGFVARIARVLARKGVDVLVRHRADEYRDGSVVTAGGESVRADRVILATPVGAPGFLGDSGLALDGRGFVTVNRFLQSVSHPDVFACGDVCEVAGMGYPKAGVFAVRQARTLAGNLVAHLGQGRAMAEFPARPEYLSIISLGNRTAIASYGRRTWMGRWVWAWKNWLDRSFMRRLAA